MQWLNQLFEKTGSIGAIIAAMGCAACFPALGSLAAMLGLGFLAQFEGIFINTLLPIFAALALAANFYAFTLHKNIMRGILGIAGPLMVLLTLYPLWTYGWSTYLFYAGLLLMLVSSLLELIYPSRKACAVKKQGAQ